MGSRSRGSGCWRRLPTAWIHLFLVECRHIYLAAACWYHLLNNINARCSMLSHQIGTSRIERYYASLFFFGYAPEVRVDFNGGKPLVLPEQYITDEGVNVPWIILAWILPLAAVLLMVFIIYTFAAVGTGDFGSARYLHFTWHLARRKPYQYAVALMAVGPVLLPAVWFFQVVWYTTDKEQYVNLWVMKECTVSGLLLLFSLNLLAFPSAAVHRWDSSPDFMALHFRRSWLCLFLQSNYSFGAKLVDALWCAQQDDSSRLERYVPEPGMAEKVLLICTRAQNHEVSARRDAELVRLRRSTSGGSDSSKSDDVAADGASSKTSSAKE